MTQRMALTKRMVTAAVIFQFVVQKIYIEQEE